MLTTRFIRSKIYCLSANVEMQDGAREFRKPRHSSHTQAKANHDLQAADFAKHSSLLINNVKGKKREEDY
ncbi:MAG: hypothetical protein M3227_05270 [Thermoproteota archaeon]|nr:hypothetical protein [Thermoproteota archaeon]